jgi:peptide deformylase
MILSKLNLFLGFVVILVFASCSPNRFTLKEKRVIRKGGMDEVMQIMLVGNRADSVILYKKSRNILVNPRSKQLTKLVQRMYTTVRDTNNPGVGIAAPQVGINKRIIWVQRFDKQEKPFEAYLNTHIVYYSKTKSEGLEGCLSIPGYRGLVNRSDTIVVNYDIIGQTNLSDTITGFTSVIFQHEIDHLEGVLYTDRITDKSKLSLLNDNAGQ